MAHAAVCSVWQESGIARRLCRLRVLSRAPSRRSSRTRRVRPHTAIPKNEESPSWGFLHYGGAGSHGRTSLRFVLPAFPVFMEICLVFLRSLPHLLPIVPTLVRLLLVGWPTWARKLNQPDRPIRVQWPLKPDECRRGFVGQDPCVVVGRHSPEQGGE